VRKVSLVGLIFVLAITSGVVSADTFQQSEGETYVVSVDSTNLRFSPETITLNEGDSVRFFWSGELLAHNAVEVNGLFDSGEAARNVDYTYTFEIGENGTYEYVCEPHEDFGMVGTIVVNPAPVDEENPEPTQTSSDNSLPGFGFVVSFVALSLAITMRGRGDRK
tara:strand:+ start:97 stop:591 length:495 start_codon:yes stop_codon:yes gene_type:complete